MDMKIIDYEDISEQYWGTAYWCHLDKSVKANKEGGRDNWYMKSISTTYIIVSSTDLGGEETLIIPANKHKEPIDFYIVQDCIVEAIDMHGVCLQMLGVKNFEIINNCKND